MHRSLFILLGLLSLSSVAFGQVDFRPGFIITLENDSIHGFISYKENGQNEPVCYFKPALEGKITPYSPNAIQGFRFQEDKYMASMQLPLTKDSLSEPVFAEILVKGKMQLIKHNLAFYAAKDGKLYKLEQEEVPTYLNGKRAVKIKKPYLGILSYLMQADCATLRSQITKTNLNEKHLVKLFEAYNGCVGIESQSYAESKSWGEFKLGGIAGIQFSRLSFEPTQGYSEGNYPGNPNSKIIPVFGLTYTYSSPRLNERFAIAGHLLFSMVNYEAVNVIDQDVRTIKNDYSIELSQLKLPLGIRYNLPTKFLQPYLTAGLSYTFHLKTASHWEQERNFMGIITQEEANFELKKSQFGPFLALGLQANRQKGGQYFLEVYVEKTNGITAKASKPENAFKSNVLTTQLSLGMRF